MTARFAGSRHLDERRRRRLASSTDEGGQASDTQSFTSAPMTSRRNGKRSSETPKVSHFPLRKLISPKAWKLWGIGFVGLLTGVALLKAGQMVAQPENNLGPVFAGLFAFTSGQIPRVYGSLLLLLSGQLAMLIWWVRSRSPLDFAGKYRIWSRIAAAGIIASLLLITDAHHLAMEIIARHSSIDRIHQLQLCWLIPITLFATFFVGLMHREMQDNRTSTVLLWLAAGCGLMTALQSVDVILPGTENRQEMAQAGTALFAQLSLFMGLLLHGRYVIYVTADPPVKRTKRVHFRLPGIRIPKIRLPRLRLPKISRPSKAIAPADQSEPSPSPSPSLPLPLPLPQQKTKITVEKQPDSPSRKTAEPIKAESAAASDPLEESVKNLRVDEPIDQGSLKGLSKKERRQLRKQHRKMQRSSRSSDYDDENYGDE